MAKQSYKLIAGTTTFVATDFTSDAPRTPIFIFCNPTAGAITINLPEIATLGYLNTRLIIVDTNAQAGTNNITIAPNAADTINGQAGNVVINTNNGIAIIECASATSWAGTLSATGNQPTVVDAAAAQADFAAAPYTTYPVGQMVSVTDYAGTGDGATFQRIVKSANNFNDWRVISTEAKASTGATGSKPA